MNRIITILFLGLLSALGLHARETVRGTVRDASGDPIPGVRVEVPGTSDYVFTDLDGAFQILLREPVKKLKFSYPGYSDLTFRVSPEMDVTLGKGWAGREKGFRAMIDIEGGMGINGKTTIESGDRKLRDYHTFLLAGLTYTLGYQLNRHLFVGIGFGMDIDVAKYEDVYNNSSNSNRSWLSFPFVGGHVPVFLDARWDFGLTKKTAPYVDLRLGYSRFFKNEGGYITSLYSYGSKRSQYTDFYINASNSIYIAPSVGYRMSLYKKIGMNIGIRYVVGMNRELFTITKTYDLQNGYERISEDHFKQRGSDVILFNIGLDF